MSELLNVYYKNRKLKGVDSRQKIHQQGEWHETFQCIFTQGDNIFLQKRSSNVKDYKDMIDVTVGGHLLNNETVDNGTREIEEEMSLQIGFESLSFLCTLPEEMISGDMIDREFINIYTLEVSEEDLSSIQHDTEVENLLKINLKAFYNFCINNAENCKGYTVISDEEITFTKNDFLPYSNAYFMCIGALLYHKK